MQNRDTEISMVILPWDQARGIRRLHSAYCSIYTYVEKAEKLKTSGLNSASAFSKKPNRSRMSVVTPKRSRVRT